ncbi:MAG: ABC transporter ATP-binding protein [Lachnospiraceae bacterium]|nr:ABC transporter ATP-binding protein [Lachnospiraceae bacterium]
MKRESQKGVWKRTFNIFRQFEIPYVLFLLYFLLSIVSTKVGLLYLPYYSKMQTGEIGEMSTLWGFIGFMLLSLVVGMCEVIPQFYAESQVTRNLQKKLFYKVLHLPVKDFEQETPSELISRVTFDSELANSIIASILGFLSGFATMWMMLSDMSAINSVLGFILIPIFIYILITVWVDGKIGFLTRRRLRLAMSQTTAFFSEHMPNLLNIKQLGAEEDEKKRGKEAIEIMYKADLYDIFLGMITTFFSGSTNTIIAILVFVFGAKAVREGAMDVTGLAQFYQLILLAYGAIEGIPSLYTSLMCSNGELYYVGKLMASEEEQYERKVEMPLVDEDIHFENVSFAYDEENTLENVSCTIPGGKKTAIAGLNGSGKTTMLKLIERFYKVSSGTIRYGETSVEDIHLGQWRQNFGYVLQKPRLFDASIRENIVYGIEREVSEEEVITAAKKACAWDFIEKIPEGLDFVVGDNGCRLSQGEKQRIAIARAILVDPAYLLLDEATSNVDVESKAIIDKALSALMKGRTTVFISHDPQEIKTADHVIVLNNKSVEAQGTAEEIAGTSATLEKILTGGTA